MKNTTSISFLIFWLLTGWTSTRAQTTDFLQQTDSSAYWSGAEVIHLNKLHLNRRKQETFKSRDSILILQIDTLIMKDRSSLHFFGKSRVKLLVKHAEIGKRVFINGISQANNASNFDIRIKFASLGSFYVMANGLDVMNGTRTDPNGDAGDVYLQYDPKGVIPQQENAKKTNYLYVDIRGGGRNVNPTADLTRIYEQIKHSGSGLRGIPQGQIYSGIEGRDGKVRIEAKKEVGFNKP